MLTPPEVTDSLRLLVPAPALLPGYAAALATGWSPDTTQDVSAAQLAALRADPEAFLCDILRQDGTLTLADGREVPRLPNRPFWLWDGEFCGRISLRYQPGTEALPDHVLGHVGYTVVPWKRRRGYATRALAMILPVAAELGLAHIGLTCDEANIPSRKVIEANGGELTGATPSPHAPGQRKLLFRVATGAA